MTHDPERAAAAYLSGSMSRRRRKALEEHILQCEDCWSEVDAGRRGRSMAEQGRELAPQRLRERARMSVEAMPAPKRRWRRFAFAASAAAVAFATAAVALYGTNERSEQPAEIALLVADFESSATLKNVTGMRLPRRLGDLRLSDSRAGRVHGMEVTAHEYVDPAGHEVVVYQADRTFPIAAGAEHDRETWTAEVDGAVLFCADHPVPSLVVGDDRKEVALAASELRLR
jgi:hypothetical protein